MSYSSPAPPCNCPARPMTDDTSLTLTPQFGPICRRRSTYKCRLSGERVGRPDSPRRGTSPSPRVVFDRATFPLSPPVDSRRVSGYGLGGLFGYEDGDGSKREGARPDVDEAGVLD